MKRIVVLIAVAAVSLVGPGSALADGGGDGGTNTCEPLCTVVDLVLDTADLVLDATEEEREFAENAVRNFNPGNTVGTPIALAQYAMAGCVPVGVSTTSDGGVWAVEDCDGALVYHRMN